MYAGVSINDEWLNDSVANNSELFNSLTKQPDGLESRVNTTAKYTEQVVQIDDTISSLTVIAKENGYIIHDVSGDGDCLFSSIGCQLQSYNIDKHTLRSMLVSFFENHPYINGTHYRDFLSQPVSSIDPYNADTEAPTNEDAYIATISDPNTQA